MFIDIEKKMDPLVFHEKYTLAVMTGTINTMSLVWAGAEWGVAWEEEFGLEKKLNFMRFTSDGEIIGDILCISDDGSPSHPQLIWNGEIYALVWGYKTADKCYIKIAAIDNGEKIDLTEFEINSDVISYPSMTWTGDHYTIAWSDNPDGSYKIYTSTIDEDGSILGSKVLISVTDTIVDHKRPFLLWDGAQYALAWQEYTETKYNIYFHRFTIPMDPDGIAECISCDINSENAYDCMNPVLGYYGNGYGVCWENRVGETETEIYFASLNSNGEKVDDICLAGGLENPPHPSLSWNEEGYIASWRHNTGDEGSDMYVAYITSNGPGIIKEDICIEEKPLPFPAMYSSSSIAWDGLDFGLIYSINNQNKSEIYFFY